MSPGTEMWRESLQVFAKVPRCFKRKPFRLGTTTLVAGLMLCGGSPSNTWGQPVPSGTLDPLTIPKYVQPLVIPPVMNNSGLANDYDVAVRQFQQQILPGGHWNAVSPACQASPGLCNFPATTVWSYGPAQDPLPDSSGLPGGAVGLAPALNSQFNYPAFTIEATNGNNNMSGVPVTVDWINDLKEDFGAGPNFLPHLLTIDQTLHWANPSGRHCSDGTNRTDCRGTDPKPYTGPVPIITHVHGGHTNPDSDGYPEAWYLPDAANIDCGGLTTPTPVDDFECEGTLANEFGTAPNTNVTPGIGSFMYRNDQPSATLWYHDHTLGMTRNNVYAGPAGFWLIRQNDGGEDGLISGTLPGPAPIAGDDPNFTPATRERIREIPVVIQDRSFNADGSLFYPANRAFFEGVQPNRLNIKFVPHSDISPFWNPEAFFNTMVVNGTTWPVLNVAQAQYRFRLLDGCNSRFLNLSLFVVNPDGTLGAEIPFYQIGVDQGVLLHVVKVETGFKTVLPGNGTIPAPAAANDPEEALLLGPAERADVIVSFIGLPSGTRVRMINTAPDAPFGGFPDAPADPNTSGQVMEFVVDSTLNGQSPTDPGQATSATPPQNLVLTLPDSADPAAAPGQGSVVRDLALLEEESVEVCVAVKPNEQIKQLRQVKPGPNFLADCTAAGGEPFGPRAAVLGINGAAGGTVTLWADPVITDPALGATETWEFWNVTADAHPIHLHMVKFKVTNRQVIGGTVRLPEATEEGWKDTVIAFPGEITRVKATFDIPGLYVWHCHILEHEDNEMMVSYCVGNPNANGCQNVTVAP